MFYDCGHFWLSCIPAIKFDSFYCHTSTLAINCVYTMSTVDEQTARLGFIVLVPC